MRSPDDIRSKCRQCVVVGVALGLNAIVGVVAAQSPPQETPPPKSATSKLLSWVELVPLPIEPQGLPADITELCEDKLGSEPGWIDRLHRGLYRTICLSAAGFDGFFGNARFDDEYQATHGSVAVGTLWDQRDHWDPSIRFRVQAHLPQMSERFSAFVGKVNPDEYVTDLRDDFDTLPRQFAREDDDAVLLGLGYRQPGRGGGKFDVAAGVELDWPLDPFAKVTYRFALPFLKRNILRLQETIFWQESEGRFGATTRIDLERLLAEAFLVRWTASGAFTQETEGIRWFSSLTLYQNLGNGRALAYQAAISGESDAEVAIADYGLRVIYRRRVHLEWLFLELRSSVTWPRDTLLEPREADWGAGVALEMLFGERTRN
jgi:hypothetical protein